MKNVYQVKDDFTEMRLINHQLKNKNPFIKVPLRTLVKNAGKSLQSSFKVFAKFHW